MWPTDFHCARKCVRLCFGVCSSWLPSATMIDDTQLFSNSNLSWSSVKIFTWKTRTSNSWRKNDCSNKIGRRAEELSLVRLFTSPFFDKSSQWTFYISNSYIHSTHKSYLFTTKKGLYLAFPLYAIGVNIRFFTNSVEWRSVKFDFQCEKTKNKTSNDNTERSPLTPHA